MDFVKKHYEKILLSLVLLGLAVATWFMSMKVDREKEEIDRLHDKIQKTRPKELSPLDLTNQLTNLPRLRNPKPVLISGSHNVFNPVTWQKRPDGSLVKIVTGREIGAGALEVTNITPLYLIVTHEGVVEGDTLRYKIGVERQSAARAPDRRKTMRTATVGSKNDLFTLKEVKDPKEDPPAFVLQLHDEKETITITKEEPYKKVMGYAADLRYPVQGEEKNFPPGLRVGQTLTLPMDTYKIVAITENDVTVQANSNSKRTVIPVKVAP